MGKKAIGIRKKFEFIQKIKHEKTGLESVGRENSRRIPEIRTKINDVNENVSLENQQVIFTF
jgi:hypothetical protein